MSSQPDHEPSTTDAAERRLEQLAEEIEQIILRCAPREREALHGYAVSLVRDRLPPIETDDDEDSVLGDDEDAQHAPERTGGAASLIGYGILLLLVGLPLLIVFPLVGILLFAGGAGMCVLGFLVFLFAKSGLSAQRTG